MNNNVSTNALTNLAGEITSAVGNLKSVVEATKESSANVVAQCETLGSYNNQKVAGSDTVKNIMKKDKDGNNQIDKSISYWKVWQISGQEEIKNACHNLEQELSYLEDTITAITSEKTNIESIAEVIEQYIQNVQNELGDSIDSSILASAFGVLGTSIAYSAEEAGENNYISRDKILDEYWTGFPLRFERQPNGTYLIYKKEANGQEVAMGYTSALTATLYFSKLKNEIKGPTQTSTPISTPKEENVNEELIKAGNTKYITQNEISDAVKKEIGEYAQIDISSSSPTEKQNAYQNLSQEARDIIDGKTQVLDPKKDMQTIIDHKADVVVQNREHFYINGSRTVGTDMILRYDPKTDQYRLVTSTGEFAHGGYSRNEMLKSEVK